MLTIWWNAFPKWRFFGIKQCPLLTLTAPPSHRCLCFTSLFQRWCMGNAWQGGAPVKPCIHAKIHFTSTALISLQPEAHKLPQCVWSWWANTSYGHRWGLNIQQAKILRQNQLNAACESLQWMAGQTNAFKCIKKTKNNNLWACLISWVDVGKSSHIAALFEWNQSF